MRSENVITDGIPIGINSSGNLLMVPGMLCVHPGRVVMATAAVYLIEGSPVEVQKQGRQKDD